MRMSRFPVLLPTEPVEVKDSLSFIETFYNSLKNGLNIKDAFDEARYFWKNQREQFDLKRQTVELIDMDSVFPYELHAANPELLEWKLLPPPESAA